METTPAPLSQLIPFRALQAYARIMQFVLRYLLSSGNRPWLRVLCNHLILQVNWPAPKVASVH